MSALSAKLAAKEITILDEIKFAEVKTKHMQEMLNAFGFNKKTLIVVNSKDEAILRVANNIPNVEVTTQNLLNTYELVANTNIVITKEAAKSIEEAYLA